MIRFLIYGTIGSIPGAVYCMVQFRIGLAWALAGACLAMMFAIKGVSAIRVFRLTIAFIIGKNVPGKFDLIATGPEETSGENQSFNDKVGQWFIAATGWLWRSLRRHGGSDVNRWMIDRLARWSSIRFDTQLNSRSI